jgi:xanthine dehydrogenase accessory factor
VWDWLRKLDELGRAGKRAALVTVTSAKGSTPCALGAKMVVLDDGTFFGTVGGGHLEQLAIADGKKAAQSGEPGAFKYTLGAQAGQCCGGVVEIFIDVLGTYPRLYLFGAGHVAQALVRVLQGTPFEVHVVDEREDWLEKMPDTVRRRVAWDVFVKEMPWDDRSYVAIMTHRHDLDQELVAYVIERPAKYLGLIGSKTKWEKFQARLGERGVAKDKLARIKCPIGLDTGGKAPQEVAISVAAELLKVHYGR